MIQVIHIVIIALVRLLNPPRTLSIIALSISHPHHHNHHDQGEVEDLVELLSKHNHKDFKMDTVFGIPVINILWTIVAGD